VRQIESLANCVNSDDTILIARHVSLGSAGLIAKLLLSMASGFLGIRQQNVKAKDVHREHGIHNFEATRPEEPAEALVRLDQVFVAFLGHGIEFLAEMADEFEFVVEKVFAGLGREVARRAGLVEQFYRLHRY
jgi:hypothetical protein